ncbi:cyclophilin-like fold protein [Streptomyces sp. LN245]|uniref:cyclophilin-like fold protein n=1 Tax=Streptomyces sp. LN245 TaxID=3112975 RepID=UPI0037104E55
MPDCPLNAAALRFLVRAVPATGLLLTVVACTDKPTSPAAASSTQQETPTAKAQTAPSDRNTGMNTQLIDGRPVSATLNDSAAACDFAALLSITLEVEDFHQTERIAYLPRKLDTSGAPNAAKPRTGDLPYYAPWGNLALFYRDGDPPSTGLIILGHDDDGDSDRLATADRITIEAASRPISRLQGEKHTYALCSRVRPRQTALRRPGARRRYVPRGDH